MNPYAIQFPGSKRVFPSKINHDLLKPTLDLTPIPGMAEDENMRAGHDGTLLNREMREDRETQDALNSLPEKEAIESNRRSSFAL